MSLHLLLCWNCCEDNYSRFIWIVINNHPWELIDDMQMSILYNRKHWHSFSHSLHFVSDAKGDWRPTCPPQWVIFKPGFRLPIFNSVYLGLVLVHIDSPYLTIMSWITIPRDEYYSHGFFYLVIILLIILPSCLMTGCNIVKGISYFSLLGVKRYMCSTTWLQNMYCKILFKIQGRVVQIRVKITQG